MSDISNATPVDVANGSDLDTSMPMETAATSGEAISVPVESWNHHGGESSPADVPGVISTHNHLRRRWDDYDAYLFDIDGTLLHCRDAVHYFAFCDVLSRVAGRSVTLDGIPVQGKIDPGILRDAFERAGVPETLWRPQLGDILRRMGEHVETHAAEFDIEVLPGVRDVLQHLQQRGALLGVGTGNLQRIGWAKLTRCELRVFFTLGGFSDQYEERGAMIAGAVAKARELLGTPDAAVLVLGDTPGDIAAARFAGVDVLAIATGIYPAAQLTGADLVVSSLLALLPRQ